MKNNKKLGIFFIVLPFAILIFSLIAFSVARQVLSAVYQPSLPTGGSAGQLTSEPNNMVVIAQIINVTLSLLGIIGVAGIFIFVPLGIYLLAKSEVDISILQQNLKYQNLTPEQIRYIAGVSGGAFFGGFIWALGNKLYVWMVLSFIPFVNIYALIKLFVSGRKMSWEQGKWQDFEQFKKRQKILSWIILVVIILSTLASIAEKNASA